MNLQPNVPWSGMAHLHCRRRTRVQTWIWIPNLMATLHCVAHVHVAQTWACLGIGQESRVRTRIRVSLWQCK